MTKKGVKIDKLIKSHKKKYPLPSFITKKPDFTYIISIAKKYKNNKNIILCGRGGSVSSFRAIYDALGSNKSVYIIDTIDPTYLKEVRTACNKKDTIVIIISHSGETVDVLENYFYFHDYKKLVITKREGTLATIAKKEKVEHILHPEIGGRFTGTTVVNLLPSAIIGINIQKVWEGMNDILDEEAFKLAVSLHKLERRGFTEVYVPIYAYELQGFEEFIQQIMHETVCKKRKGQTFLCYHAPECHHHTHQRFFGGRRNCIGLFIRVNAWENEIHIKIPQGLKNIPLRNSTLEALNNGTLGKNLNYEYIGTKLQADKQRIPNFTITLDKINEHEVGQLLTLFQLVAIYSAYLRRVDPFTQPDVEEAKKISFALRKHEV